MINNHIWRKLARKNTDKNKFTGHGIIIIAGNHLKVTKIFIN